MSAIMFSNNKVKFTYRGVKYSIDRKIYEYAKILVHFNTDTRALNVEQYLNLVICNTIALDQNEVFKILQPSPLLRNSSRYIRHHSLLGADLSISSRITQPPINNTCAVYVPSL